MYSRILVPVDLDNVDKLSKAIDLAGKTAKESDAEIIYVDVVDAVPTMSARTDGERMADRLRKFAADQSAAYGVPTSDHVALRSDLHLNVGSDIIKAAKEADCDLIVMASHVPGFKDHILSSNAGYVASHAPMSVYVVR
ncbi:universal stress protein [Sulfitobacter sp. JBTF-M27]|uniref:Universal stress protein n=1 Tax=Sulfitobacter sediminilitoris TaxID=2698830 RepID=A0A6P0C9R4_9RHOB|nr:universal stress protein [Sulfitobacter sediminilitoris]NEK21084.1 universal stress protein [Sulfitobacter sediminilitoris]